MSDVFEVFAEDVHTAKVPGLGLVDFVRWQTVVDKWEQPAPTIPPDVRETLRETIQRERDSLAWHTNERKQYCAIYKRWPDGDDSLVTRWTDKLSRYDAALTWLDAQEPTPFLTAAEFTEQLIDGMRDALDKPQDGE